MYIVDGIAYAKEYNSENLSIVDLKVISELCLLVTFSNGEKRIFDAQWLMKYPVYKKLEDFNVFKEAYIENGIIVWDNGTIDVGTEMVYRKSYEYEQELVM